MTLIAALDRNRGIGLAGQLPWRLPADLGRFKKLTMGKALIMGRKTCASIGRALPGRASIVLTQNKNLQVPAGCATANSRQHALRLARAACKKLGSDEIVIIGGAQIYALFLPLADKLELTWVHTDSGADCFLGGLDLQQWRQVQRVDRPADAKNPHDLSFVSYRRLGDKN